MATEQAVQEAPAEAPATETSKEAPAQDQAPDTKPESQPKAFDPQSLPPEAQEYFKKQYSDYDKHKSLASEYQRLIQHPLFQEWYHGLRNQSQKEAPKPQKLEITDDEFVGALSDKSKFLQLVEKAAEMRANQILGPQLQQTQFEVNLQKRTNEINVTASKYPDFMELDKKGLIEPILLKYPNLGIEDAYWLAKRHTINEEIDRKARGLVEKKKSASAERPGASGARSNKVVAKSTLEAMEIAANAFRAGKEVPEIEIE